MVVIRRIRADEGRLLRAIRLQAIADTPSAFGSTLDETRARPGEYWDGRAAGASSGADNVLFVAETADGWVGLVGGYVDQEATPAGLDLISMWVAPVYRGQGVGRRLVEQVVLWAREGGAPQLSLWVTESNASAIALYKRCGFTDTGETQPLPSNPDLSEQRMVLDL